MESVGRERAATRATVEGTFDASAAYWRDVYGDGSFLSTVYLARHAAALAWFDAAAVPPGATILEIGCGAGFLTVELAARGYTVDAIDSSEAMVASTRTRIAEAGLADAASARLGDVHALAARDGAYAAVIALGVVPWLHSPERAFREIARVLRPGGTLIVTADNRARLNFLLDPRHNPVLVYPVKRQLKLLLRRLGRRPLGVLPDIHYPGALDRLVAGAGLEKWQSRSVGFGRFTLFGIPLVSSARSVALHHRLQRLADRGVPFIRSTGMNYMVLAAKPVKPRRPPRPARRRS